MFPRRKAKAPHAYYNYYCPNAKNNWLENMIFPFVVVTAIATACAARYTYKQWLTADDAEKRSLRAYVVANQGDVRDQIVFPFCNVKPAIIRALTSRRTYSTAGWNSRHVYIYGEVTYNDAFGGDRFLKYRYFSNDKIGNGAGATIDDSRGTDAN